MPTPNASVVVKIGALMDATVGSVFGKTTSGLKKIGDTLKELASRSQEMKRLDAASGRLGESVETLTARYEKQSGTLAKAEASFAKVKEKITAAGGADEKLATQLTRADEAVTRARANLDRTNVSLAKAKTDYTDASAAAEKFRAANQHVESSLNQLGAAMKRYESASTALQANEAKRAEYRSKMLGVLAAGYAIRKTVEKAAEGEEAGLKLKWSLDGGDARHQIGSIIEQTRAIAARTMATAPELFRIQAVLNRESLSADESRIASETIHKVASVTGQDATETAKAIAGIYNTVGLQMVGSTQQKLSHIGDLATAMQQRFAIDDIGSLGAGLAKALPQATMARVSFEQTGAAIGALTRHGLDAGAAGQQMSAVLINMTKASKQLGFQLVHDAKGNLDFEGTILAMQARLNRMGGIERNRDALTKAFSRRGAGAAFLLMEAAATGDLVKAQNALANSTGTVDQEYKELEDSAKGMLLRITKAFNETLMPIGRALLPGLKTVLEPIGKLATWVGGFLEKHKTLAAWLGGITTALIAMTAAVYAGGYAWAFLHGGWLRAGQLLAWLKLRIVAHRLEVLADAGAEETATVATDGLAVAETEEATAGAASKAGFLARIPLLGRLATALGLAGDAELELATAAGTAETAQAGLMATLAPLLGVGLLGAATGGAIAYHQMKENQAATDERWKRWSGTHIVLNHGAAPSPGAALEAAQLPGGHAIPATPVTPLHTGLDGLIEIKQPKKMAKGGIATKPTLVEVGDAGTEGIVPLPHGFRQGLGHSTTITIHMPITIHSASDPVAVASQIQSTLERAVRDAEARRRGGMHD
jgi:TP901 family phage tail tape measure protein